MRTLLCCALVLALLPGCKRAMNKMSEDTKVKPNEKFTTTKDWLTDQKGPGVHGPTGVVVNQGGGGGGGGGAAQAIRKAAVRTVNFNELNNIRQFMDSASAVEGQLPTKQAIEQVLMREARATYDLVREGAIVLTGARTRESVWAYTRDAQTANGEHLVIRNANVEKMTAGDLQQALQQSR